MKKAPKKTIKKPKTIEDKIDDLAIMMAKGFSSMEERLSLRIEKIETTLPLLATKADILALHDQFVHRREFDMLSLRMSKVEEKMRK